MIFFALGSEGEAHTDAQTVATARVSVCNWSAQVAPVNMQTVFLVPLLNTDHPRSTRANLGNTGNILKVWHALMHSQQWQQLSVCAISLHTVLAA